MYRNLNSSEEGTDFLHRIGDRYLDLGAIQIPDYNKKLGDQFKDSLSRLKTSGSIPSYGPYVSSASLKQDTNIGGVGNALSDFSKSLSSMSDGLGEGGVFGNMASSVGGSMKGSKKGGGKGDDSRGGLIKQLLQIITGVLSLPMRFTNVFQSLMDTGMALGLGAEGLGKSTLLGIKDLFLLFVAILKVFIKYVGCLLSFALTTVFGGCFIPHIITFLFYILYLIFPITSFLVYSASGLDLDPYIDDTFDMIHKQDEAFVKAGTMPFHVTKWPEWIELWCYACFFKKVKLKDVLKDVMVVKQIGDLITHDFKVTMPRYMRPASGPAISAKQHLDAAMN